MYPITLQTLNAMAIIRLFNGLHVTFSIDVKFNIFLVEMKKVIKTKKRIVKKEKR
jgi:hypothetical protein